MKIYKGGYKNNWVSPYTILLKVLWWKSEDDIYDMEVPVWLNKACQKLHTMMNFINPRIDYIKIDRYDAWNADVTLASIIHPVLVTLKADAYSSGIVEDADVPDKIKSMNAPRVVEEYDVDEFFHDRWAYVLDEMIFAFKSLKNDEYYDGTDGRVNNGLRLFGKYYRNLWN